MIEINILVIFGVHFWCLCVWLRKRKYLFLKFENDDECAVKMSDHIQLQHKSYILICERLYAYTFKSPEVESLRWSWFLMYVKVKEKRQRIKYTSI